MEILSEIAEGIIKGNANLVKERVFQALDADVLPLTILKEGLIAGLDVVGENFRKREIFVPNLLLSARAMNMGMKVLEPLLKEDNAPVAGKVVLGTVEGDLHDIGKNLVAFMLRNGGFEVIDLGFDVSKEQFIEAVEQYQPDILAMCALLTSTVAEFAEVIRSLTRAALRDKVKIIVGGAPVSRSLAEKIGADAYIPDAVAAVEVAKNLLRQS
ncbi:MAG: corrinoid protein [Negativicutes bacterium]|nr:corrinoid protein [Negativicutes bacterium]